MDACNAMQYNAMQYNTIRTYIYIYIYIYPFFGAYLIFRQTNFPGCVPPISFEVSWYFAVWNGVCAGFGASKPRVTPKFRQQTETPFSPFPATQGIRTRPVRVVAGDRATKVGAGRLKRRTTGWVWEMGRRCCGEHWPAKDPKCCDISWVQGMDTCPAGPSV
jgi:hypothetical protein